VEYKFNEITEQVIKAYYTVYNTLGYGFQEKVYRNAMLIELDKLKLNAAAEVPIAVYYKGQVIGEYFADLVADEAVIIELKAVSKLLGEHEAQLLNYLKATSYEVGLLLNFGPKAEFKRKAFDNERKGTMLWLKPSDS
jgi:GxxExxY protein